MLEALLILGLGYAFFRMHKERKTGDATSAQAPNAPAPRIDPATVAAPDLTKVYVPPEARAQQAASVAQGAAPIGSRDNPIQMTGSLYNDQPGVWGTRVVNGVREFGRFTQPVTMFGKKVYKYVKES